MKYAGIIKNDVAAGEGVCLTLFTQGCPHHCKNCHNPETWAFDGGKDFTTATMKDIISGLIANGVQRNFAIMGGEPLCPENRENVLKVIWEIRHEYPNIKIYVWTGYIYENLLKENDPSLQNIFENIDYLIDGPYVEEQRDITLPMRGSKNQRVLEIHHKNNEFIELN